MKTRFAFAVNNSNVFEMKHFGEAEKYLIYEWNGSELKLHNSIENPYLHNSANHHSSEKGQKLVTLLKTQQVNVLVSKQFGKNIKRVNAFFVPVLINSGTPEELLPLLKKQMRWIIEELQFNSGNYKLFNLQKGTIKIAI